MIRTLIVDDEALAIRRLEIKLTRYKDVEIIGHSRNGDSALSDIKSLRPDLVLLDINMPGMDGLSVSEQTLDLGVFIIFVTAFHQYAVQAFERNAVDYLLKPVSTDRLDMALERFRARREQDDAAEHIRELKSVITQLRATDSSQAKTPEPQYFWTKGNGVSQKIALHNIEWIEAARDYVTLHMQGGQTHFIRNTMANFEKRLDQSLFQRVHRSAIVNVSQISKVSHKDGVFKLFLNSGAQIRVGRVYKSKVSLRLKEISSSLWT